MVGITFLSGAMHTVGLFGAPRRTSFSSYFDSAVAAGWDPYLILIGLGATILLISVFMVVYLVFHLMFKAPKGATELPIAEVGDDGSTTTKWTERWCRRVVLIIDVS